MRRLLILLLLPLAVLAADPAAEASARLARVGKAVETYKAIYGQPPASMKQLFERGFLRNLDDLRLPGSKTRFPTLDELDAKADLTLARNDPTGALVVTRSNTAGPRLAYHTGGRITTPEGREVRPAHTTTPPSPVVRHPDSRPVTPPTPRPPAHVDRVPDANEAVLTNDDDDDAPELVIEGEDIQVEEHDDGSVTIKGDVEGLETADKDGFVVTRNADGSITIRPPADDLADDDDDTQPQPQPKPPTLPVNAAYMQGMALLTAGKYQQAEVLLRQATAEAPTVAQFRSAHGTAFYYLGNYQQAVQEYQNAVTLDPNTAVYRNNLSMALRLTGKYREAIAAANEAIRRDGKQAAYYFSRGMAEEAAGQFASAQASFTQSVKLAPTVADYHFAVARALAWQKKNREAMPSIDRAVKLAPTRVDMLDLRGNLFFNLQDYRSAIAVYQQAVQLQPGFAQAYADMAGAIYMTGDVQNARTWAAAAIQRGCRSHWVYARLGMTVSPPNR